MRQGARCAVPGTRDVIWIRGFRLAEILKRKDAGERGVILLRGQSCRMQFPKRCLASSFCGAEIAPMKVFRSHIGDGQPDASEHDYHQRNIETHAITLQQISPHPAFDVRVTRLIASVEFNDPA
jgi:hypothetical protein